MFGIVSRHSSTDYAPCVEAYQKKKWCNVCNVKVRENKVIDTFNIGIGMGKRWLVFTWLVLDCMILNVHACTFVYTI